MKKEDIFPDFLPMLQYVLEKASIRVRTAHRHIVGDRTLAYHPLVYTEILNYLRSCMIHSAGVTPEKDCLSLAQFAAPEISQLLKFLIESKAEGKAAVFKLVEFTELLLGATQGPAQAQCMLQLIGCTSAYTAQR